MNSANQLIIDNIVYDIENYETMNIIIKRSNESINIRLLNVELMLKCFIKLIRLIKIMKKKDSLRHRKQETTSKRSYLLLC